ncbi:MAG TPA: amidohydrolase family protein [Actinomycetota bacterium]|nr:amidohydrolase family protein [Actinomycetota bacterium]
MLLRAARLADGAVVDVRTGGERIVEVAAAGSLRRGPDEDVQDLSGYVLLPAPAEPHAHLDKAFTAGDVPNPAGDLDGAIEAWIAYRVGLTVSDVFQRARTAALRSLAHGATAIRTHVDVGEGIELRGLEALLKLRSDLADIVPLQVVALVSRPFTGAAGAENRAFLGAAMEAGADFVGGAPHVDPDPPAALEFCLSVAADYGKPVDLHMDETLNQSMLGLADLARRVIDGFPHPVTASHCVSLGIQPRDVQQRVARDVAAAGISVVTLPQTNLYLQGRGFETSPPRGLTAVRALLAAGATVAAGGDNVQDPFNPLGRGDPLETAGLLVAAGHLTPFEAYQLVSAGARKAMGLPEVEVAPDSPCELVAVAGSSLEEVVATASEDRYVFSKGQLASRTSVARHVIGSPGSSPADGQALEAYLWR